jgi:hypothetical protein
VVAVSPSDISVLLVYLKANRGSVNHINHRDDSPGLNRRCVNCADGVSGLSHGDTGTGANGGDAGAHNNPGVQEET